jgi:hypothetical protein
VKGHTDSDYTRQYMLPYLTDHVLTGNSTTESTSLDLNCKYITPFWSIPSLKEHVVTGNSTTVSSPLYLYCTVSTASALLFLSIPPLTEQVVTGNCTTESTSSEQ